MIWCRFHPASSCLLTLFCFFGTAIQAGAQLSSTEQRFLDLVEPIAQAPTEDFRLLPLVKMGGVGAGYRYQIAFLSYGVVSLAQSDPDRTPHYRRLFLRLLDKMEHPTTQSFWKKSGYRGDGKSRDNIMYRGHLALMYALTHFSFGSTRDSEKFHKLVNSLHREMVSSPSGGICCEPDQLFIQCNTVALLAFSLHDRLHGTDYAASGHRLLRWAQQKIPVPGTQLFRDDYRMNNGSSSLQMAGYANAWSISFLGAIPEYREQALTMYRDWKQSFAVDTPGIAIARGAPEWPSLKDAPREFASAMLCTFFGTLAAREANDRTFHRKLSRSLATIELIRPALNFLESEDQKRARLALYISLYARTFRGWSTLLEKPHPILE